MTTKADKWFQDAEHGDEFIYHTGEVCGGPHREKVMTWAAAGQVVLYQRRQPGTHIFDYCAKRIVR